MAKNINETVSEVTNFLNLGIKTVDLQHEKFFRLIEELRVYTANDEKKNFVKNLLDEFEAYSNYHFVSEERMMKKSKFPLLDSHAEQHEFFRKKIKEFKYAFEYKNEVVDEQMLNFLQKWFVLHISEHDKQYADYIKTGHPK